MVYSDLPDGYLTRLRVSGSEFKYSMKNNFKPLEIGIMQGRLTPSFGRGIQFFPKNDGEWEKEFSIAGEIGISHIEWVWDTLQNPLMDTEFRSKVRARIAETGVPVKGVDLQFLTKIDFAGVTDTTLNTICEAIADINGEAIEPPLLEGSTLLDPNTRSARIARLARFCEIAKEYALSINLETDLPPAEYVKLLSDIPDLSVVYDSGNSANMGYDVNEEWNSYASRIKNLQIKDRPFGGSTVPLGKGATDFRTLFKKVKETGYTGLVTLQSAREEDGREVETIQNYIKFVQNIYESV